MDERPTSRFSYDRSAFLYVAVTLLLGIGSLHSQNNLLFLAFGVAVGVLLVNGTYAWVSMRWLRLRRHAPSRAEVGRAVTLRYHATTRARLIAAVAVVIEERDAPGAGAACVQSVSRGAPARAEATLVPERRGELRLRRIDASSRYPFGAAKKTMRFERPAVILVRPRPIYPDERSLHAVATGRVAVPASLKRAGAGDEVFGLREYAAGDPQRRIAWRASARHGDWLVREHADVATSSVRVALRLDPDLPESVNEEAVSLSAGTLALLRARGRRAGMYDPARPGSLIESLPAALDALARLDITNAGRRDEPRATIVIEASPGGARLRSAGGAAPVGATL